MKSTNLNEHKCLCKEDGFSISRTLCPLHGPNPDPPTNKVSEDLDLILEMAHGGCHIEARGVYKSCHAQTKAAINKIIANQVAAVELETLGAVSMKLIEALNGGKDSD